MRRTVPSRNKKFDGSDGINVRHYNVMFFESFLTMVLFVLTLRFSNPIGIELLQFCSRKPQNRHTLCQGRSLKKISEGVQVEVEVFI
jgi:hypothetical protein